VCAGTVKPRLYEQLISIKLLDKWIREAECKLKRLMWIIAYGICNQRTVLNISHFVHFVFDQNVNVIIHYPYVMDVNWVDTRCHHSELYVSWRLSGMTRLGHTVAPLECPSDYQTVCVGCNKLQNPNVTVLKIIAWLYWERTNLFRDYWF